MKQWMKKQRKEKKNSIPSELGSLPIRTDHNIAGRMAKANRTDCFSTMQPSSFANVAPVRIEFIVNSDGYEQDLMTRAQIG